MLTDTVWHSTLFCIFGEMNSKRSHNVIVTLTVQEILDEHIAK